MSKRSYFIGSVGQPGEGYDDANLDRCINCNAHLLYCDTIQKGVFNEVETNSIIFLKYKDKLIAYGKVVRKVQDDEYLDSLHKGWNWGIYVEKWYFYDENDKTKGVSNYGVGRKTIGGGQMGTVKKITEEYALIKMKEVNSETDIYQEILKLKTMQS